MKSLWRTRRGARWSGGWSVWDVDVASLGELLERFAQAPRDAPWPAHPAFGSMSGSAWGVLTYRHIDHHFRQFSI